MDNEAHSQYSVGDDLLCTQENTQPISQGNSKPSSKSRWWLVSLNKKVFYFIPLSLFVTNVPYVRGGITNFLKLAILLLVAVCHVTYTFMIAMLVRFTVKLLVKMDRLLSKTIGEFKWFIYAQF